MTNSKIDKELVLTVELFSKDFNIDKNELAINNSFAELKSKVTSIISYYLDKDLNTLLTIFYRIDLGEEKVKRILAYEAPEKVADLLAEAVLERELEKVKTRIKYSKGPNI